MLTEVCAYLKNYFLTNKENDVYPGQYEISGGTLNLDRFLVSGQYFRILGSKLNDGVYLYPAFGLRDETFTGAIWAMSVPPAFVDLVEEIAGWVETNNAKLSSPYTSESFGGYSYSKGSGKDGGAYTWQDQFATRLAPYRRLFLP